MQHESDVPVSEDDADAEQQKLRMSLVDDPNRYIRAAARKEIAWPGPVA
jgi:hypothetical protein